jgi:hypothetical protein
MLRPNVLVTIAAFWKGATRPQRIAVVFGVLLVVVAISSLVWSVLATTPPQSRLPGYALRSTFVFEVERALALIVGFAVVGAFTARLIAGDLPSGITTSGIEWKAELDIAAGLTKAQQSVEDVTHAAEANSQAIETLRSELDSLGARVSGEVAIALETTQSSLGALKRATDAQTQGLRIIAEELRPLVGQPELLAGLDRRVQALQESCRGLDDGVRTLEGDTVRRLSERLDRLESEKREEHHDAG